MNINMMTNSCSSNSCSIRASPQRHKVGEIPGLKNEEKVKSFINLFLNNFEKKFYFYRKY